MKYDLHKIEKQRLLTHRGFHVHGHEADAFLPLAAALLAHLERRCRSPPRLKPRRPHRSRRPGRRHGRRDRRQALHDERHGADFGRSHRRRSAPRIRPRCPPGTKTIAMNGKWLIPGLMNMHVHLGLKLPGAAGDSLVNESDTAEVLRMAGNARRSLLSGVTTLRLVGRGPRHRLRAAPGHRRRRSHRTAHQDGRRSHRSHRRPRFARGGRPLRIGPRRAGTDQAGRRLDQDRDLRRHIGFARRHLRRAHDR